MSSLILKLDLKVPTCRICLQNQHNGDEKMFPIFEEEIAEKIFRCTGIKVNKKKTNKFQFIQKVYCIKSNYS